MVWCDNDLWESGAPIAYGRAKPWFALSDQGLQLHGTPVEPPGLLDASALFQALKKTLWERSFVRAQRDPEAEWALVGQIFLQAQGELAGEPIAKRQQTNSTHLSLYGRFRGQDSLLQGLHQNFLHFLLLEH